MNIKSILILVLACYVFDVQASAKLRSPDCATLVAAAAEREFTLRSALLKNVGEYRPGLFAEMNASRQLIGAMGNEHELPMGIQYAAFLQRTYGYKFLLLPSFDGQQVPVFDGVVFGASGKPLVNVSFKTLVESNNPSARVARAIGDLRRGWYRNHLDWSSLMNVSTRILGPELLRPSVKITDEMVKGVRRSFEQHFRKHGGTQVGIQSGLWLRMHKFYRVFGISEKRHSHVVISLREELGFPDEVTIHEIQRYMGTEHDGVEQVTFLLRNEVLEVSRREWHLTRMR